MRKKKKINPRHVALAILLVVSMTAYGFRMVQIQVVDAARYLAQADTTGTRKAPIKAARGEILDRYGRPIAVNRESYNIVFDSAYLPKDQINTVVGTLIGLLAQNNKAWADTTPLTAEEPYDFTPAVVQVNAMKSKLKLAHYATAANCFDQMVTRYQLEGMSRSEQRKIMGVRYSMEAADFSVSNPYTFAEDISSDLMTRIMESNFDLPGVNIEVVPVRQYTSTDIAPHIIGSVGPIYAEDWDALKAKGYSYNDKVGKNGIEKAAEDYLKGTDGVKTIRQDGTGNTISSDTTTNPVPGNTVLLSIDKNLQRVAQQELKKLVDSLSKETQGAADAGATVAVNVKTGEILLAANYPSYDLAEYSSDFQKLSEDPAKPLFDRAFNGLYPPGSTMKPVVAAAGLQTGAITTDTLIKCTHTYTRFAPDYQPSCLGYHGNINVINALSKSCNFFFFETGYRVGITKMNEYSKQLGLGVATGVEVPESKGILAGPAYRESKGQIWTLGDTIQAAIGQSDNAFTPLQLAVFTASIANGGTRYQSRLISQVRSYSLADSIVAGTPKVLNQVEFSQDVINTVKLGMLSVTEDGTGSGTFRNYPIKVGGKTGTAEAPGGSHSVFVAFAPYDDPEIAVSVVVEHGSHGSSSGPLVKAIFDAYFFTQAEQYTEPAVNTLLQ